MESGVRQGMSSTVEMVDVRDMHDSPTRKVRRCTTELMVGVWTMCVMMMDVTSNVDWF